MPVVRMLAQMAVADFDHGIAWHTRPADPEDATSSPILPLRDPDGNLIVFTGTFTSMSQPGS